MPGESDLTMVWPLSLFQWEAGRILKLPLSTDFPRYVELLLREAFEDADVADDFSNDFDIASSPEGAHAWLSDLLANSGRLRQPVPPRYYGERHGDVTGPERDPLAVTFAVDFIALVYDLQEHGYLPKILPRECVDEAGIDFAEVTATIRRAIKYEINWPVQEPNALSEPVLYSLVEFFHDQAQRPRLARWHSWNACGWHYDRWSADSGRVVYRWRVNSLLEAHDVALRLGTSGEERGRLIRRFDTPLDGLADAERDLRDEIPEDEVAHAIAQFRARGASMVQKRAALSLLAGALEARRSDLKAVLGKDESDLFNIANNFSIRHRNDAQKADYGEEYADWIFWNYLAAINLLDGLDGRGAQRGLEGA